MTDESFARTNLGDLAAGDPVNLERPVRMEDRLGGHLVQGHVDGVGVVTGRRPDGEASWLRVEWRNAALDPPSLAPTNSLSLRIFVS